MSLLPENTYENIYDNETRFRMPTGYDLLRRLGLDCGAHVAANVSLTNTNTSQNASIDAETARGANTQLVYEFASGRPYPGSMYFDLSGQVIFARHLAPRLTRDFIAPAELTATTGLAFINFPGPGPGITMHNYGRGYIV